LNQTRKEKDATRQRLRRTIMTPEEYDQMRSVNAERQRTRRSQDLRESRDKEAAKRRMQGVVLTSDELAKFKSVVLNSKTRRSDSSGVEIKIPKLRQNQENAQESEPFIDTIVKEEPKSPRVEEIDEEPKTLNDLLLNLCSENAGNVNKEQQLEEPPNLEQDSVSIFLYKTCNVCLFELTFECDFLGVFEYGEHESERIFNFGRRKVPKNF
jgi:hypothetical protein